MSETTTSSVGRSEVVRGRARARGPVRRGAFAGLVGGLVLALLLSGAATASATVPPAPAAPPASSIAAAPAASHGSSPGADARPLHPLALSRLLRQVVDAGGVGATAEVVDHGHTWRGAAGSARLSPSVPAAREAHFRAASITKMTMSVLALQLVARGRWTLDTTLGSVLPGLWPGRGGVTLRELLSHTSGMPEFDTALLTGVTTIPELVARLHRHHTDAGLVRAARTQPWLFAPGTSYSYSNTNFVVIGMMLRRATGLSLRRLLARRVLGPAQMTRTRFALRPGLPAPRLHEYVFVEGRRVDLGGFDPTFFSGAGALVTTARDLNRFQRALSRAQLLPRPLVRQMRSVQAVDPASGLQYGLGSYRLPDPCATPAQPAYVYGHDGASIGTLSLTLTSRDGRRRVTAAVTGRGRSLDTNYALLRFVGLALRDTCPPGTPARQLSGPWLSTRLASRLPDADVRRRVLAALPD